jgi:hypothetical protein
MASTAFSSVRKPGARPPLHTGIGNIRSVVRLPLIELEKCGFMGGSETCEWRVGEAFVSTPDEIAMLRHTFGTLGTTPGNASGVADRPASSIRRLFCPDVGPHRLLFRSGVGVSCPTGRLACHLRFQMRKQDRNLPGSFLSLALHGRRHAMVA